MKLKPIFETIRLPCGTPIAKIERKPNIMGQVKAAPLTNTP